MIRSGGTIKIAALMFLIAVFLLFFLPLLSLSAGGNREVAIPEKKEVEKGEEEKGEEEKSPPGDRRQEKRQGLVKRTIERRGVETPKVLEAMHSVPRLYFLLPPSPFLWGVPVFSPLSKPRSKLSPLPGG